MRKLVAVFALAAALLLLWSGFSVREEPSGRQPRETGSPSAASTPRPPGCAPVAEKIETGPADPSANATVVVHVIDEQDAPGAREELWVRLLRGVTVEGRVLLEESDEPAAFAGSTFPPDGSRSPLFRPASRTRLAPCTSKSCRRAGPSRLSCASFGHRRSWSGSFPSAAR